MRLNEDGKTVRAMDILPGMEKSWVHKERNVLFLVEKMKALGIDEELWYLDTWIWFSCSLGFWTRVWKWCYCYWYDKHTWRNSARTPLNANFNKFCFKFKVVVVFGSATLNLKPLSNKKMLSNFKFKLSQKLSPQQIQLMKLIQLPTRKLWTTFVEEWMKIPWEAGKGGWIRKDVWNEDYDTMILDPIEWRQKTSISTNI
jgi:hypothetical protein